MFTRNKMTTLVAVSTLLLALNSALSGSASAAGTSIVDGNAQLLTPLLDSTNTAAIDKDGNDQQRMADGWVKNGWYGSGLVYQVTYAPSGGLLNMTYHVTDKSGAPVVNKPVILRVGKGYSASTSMIRVDGRNTDQRGGKGALSNKIDQLNITHNTDYFGNVTFSLQNIDEPTVGVPQPKSYTDAPDISVDGLNDYHTQTLLAINNENFMDIAGQYSDHSVMTSIYYFKHDSLPSTQVATRPTLKLVAPVLNSTNSFTTAAGVKGAYVNVGSSVVIAYKVLDDAGVALPNANVEIKNGATTLTAVSDSMGYAVFTIQDTHTKGEAKPASITTAPAAAGAVALSVTPKVVGASSTSADALELHFFGTPIAAKATSTTITCTKGKTFVKVKGINPKCPKGYTKK